RLFEVPVESLVVGDLVLLSAGDAVPADLRLLEARDLHVDEAALTGESLPVEKSVEAVEAAAPLARRTCALFAGTHVVSGQGTGLVVATGTATVLGGMAAGLRERPQTAFERSLARFGTLVLELTLGMVTLLVAANMALGRPWTESLLFALALSVGLTPQLLPAIVTTTLARGARRMAGRGVIVKRLAALEDFGSMDLLFSDKTGTVTAGEVRVVGAVDGAGRDSPRTLLFARLNALLETGFVNPIDQALRAIEMPPLPPHEKLDEVPYDFVRQRLAILARVEGRRLLLVKGAVRRVLEVCDRVDAGEASVPLDDTGRAALHDAMARAGEAGHRVLAVAWREVASDRIGVEDEQGLVLAGLLVLADPVRPEAPEMVRQLASMGVAFKMVTGDAVPVARHVAAAAGLDAARVVTGEELRRLTDEALMVLVEQVDVFAQVEPHHKARLVALARRRQRITGFIGDGINDAGALRAADVGISVEGATDVARDAADIVLRHAGLDVVVDGVRAGRQVVANTFKYVFMATGANFGNMFSMAVASVALPFLPMKPAQVLLTNLLTDVPEMVIATDRVDPELVRRPSRWSLRFVRRFMLVFGLTSSFFDLATFALLALGFHAGPERFRTGWFLESVWSATLAVLLVRTRRPFWQSLPSWPLALATLSVVVATPLVLVSPLALVFGFAPLDAPLAGWVAVVVAAYVVVLEVTKRVFYRPMHGMAGGRGA
ncbi:MAG: hypothetical protein RL199_1897, partial [Pseudomonadota bacterium]